MTEEAVKRARELKESIDTLGNLSRMFGYPYPRVGNSDSNVNTAGLDAETLKQWKEVNHAFIAERMELLEEEFKSL